MRRIQNSAVLTDIIRSALLVENLTKNELIRPFKNQEQIFKRLHYLSKDLNPYLNEEQARNEFLSAIDKSMKIQERKFRISKISKGVSLEDQVKFNDQIKKSKIKE